jgi:hypothetical protein
LSDSRKQFLRGEMGDLVASGVLHVTPEGAYEFTSGPTWGDVGCERRLDKCDHAPDDGCMWCCMCCNLDTHRCPGCGTVTDHKNTACDECKKL